MTTARLYRFTLLFAALSSIAVGAVGKERPITDIHLVLNSIGRSGDWWGVTEVYVWDEKGKIVRPLKIDAKRRNGGTNNWNRASGALHTVRINDKKEQTGWAPISGGKRYDNTLGAATLNIQLPRGVQGGLLAVQTWQPGKKLPHRKISAGIATGRIFYRYGGSTTFHKFASVRNPGGVGAPTERFVHATQFGEVPKRRR